jgi:hypothetical protein
MTLIFIFIYFLKNVVKMRYLNSVVGQTTRSFKIERKE